MKTRAARSTRTKRDKRSRLRFSVLKAWWNQVHAQFLLMHVLCIWKKHTFLLATKLLKLMSLSTFCYFLVCFGRKCEVCRHANNLRCYQDKGIESNSCEWAHKKRRILSYENISIRTISYGRSQLFLCNNKTIEMNACSVVFNVSKQWVSMGVLWFVFLKQTNEATKSAKDVMGVAKAL